MTEIARLIFISVQKDLSPAAQDHWRDGKVSVIGMGPEEFSDWLKNPPHFDAVILEASGKDGLLVSQLRGLSPCPRIIRWSAHPERLGHSLAGVTDLLIRDDLPQALLHALACALGLP